MRGTRPCLRGRARRAQTTRGSRSRAGCSTRGQAPQIARTKLPGDSRSSSPRCPRSCHLRSQLVRGAEPVLRGSLPDEPGGQSPYLGLHRATDDWDVVRGVPGPASPAGRSAERRSGCAVRADPHKVTVQTISCAPPVGFGIQFAYCSRGELSHHGESGHDFWGSPVTPLDGFYLQLAIRWSPHVGESRTRLAALTGSPGKTP